MSNLYLGVDGGGSSTQAALWEIGDDFSGLCIAEVEFGPLSLKSSTKDEVHHSARALKAFIDKCANHGQIAGAALGLSGLDNEDDLLEMSQILREENVCSGDATSCAYGHSMRMQDGQCKLTSDALLPLFAAGRSEGCVVISGTGSVAYAVDSNGRMTRFGGYGYRVSDEGSGYWIGAEFIKIALRKADDALSQGIEEPNCVKCAKRIIGSDSLFEWSKSCDSPKNFAALAKGVLESKAPEARTVAKRASKALANLAVDAHLFYARNNIEQIGNKPAEIVLGGNIFKNDRLTNDFALEIKDLLGKEALCLIPQAPPTLGAARLAKHTCN